MAVYPDVPPAPGVPPLNRLPGVTYTGLALIAADAVQILSLFQGPQWGIFDQQGRPVLVGDSCKALGFTGEAVVSTYPVEQGAFQSYNKVQRPNLIKIAFTQGGPIAARSAFLAAVEAAKQSLYLFAVVTPEVTYPSVNVVHNDYRRTQREGATLLTVDVWCEQVRQAAALAFSSIAKNPSGSQQVNDGTVQPGAPAPNTVGLPPVM